MRSITLGQLKAIVRYSFAPEFPSHQFNVHLVPVFSPEYERLALISVAQPFATPNGFRSAMGLCPFVFCGAMKLQTS